MYATVAITTLMCLFVSAGAIIGWALNTGLVQF